MSVGCGADDVAEVRVLRRALDARRSVRYQLRLRVWLRGEAVALAIAAGAADVSAAATGRPVVIVGGGPAGLFAALRLAEHGVPAVVLERGKAVQARRRDLAVLNREGVVNPESNYCFGEGGAGTYSDGKLYTRSQKRGPVAAVLDCPRRARRRSRHSRRGASPRRLEPSPQDRDRAPRHPRAGRHRGRVRRAR